MPVGVAPPSDLAPVPTRDRVGLVLRLPFEIELATDALLFALRLSEARRRLFETSVEFAAPAFAFQAFAPSGLGQSISFRTRAVPVWTSEPYA